MSLYYIFKTACRHPQAMELEGGIESSDRRVVDLEGQLDELLRLVVN